VSEHGETGGGGVHLLRWWIKSKWKQMWRTQDWAGRDRLYLWIF
jgi:hypothetical protein